MRWLSALMPRETRFFALFDRHGALIVEGANAVVELVQHYEDTVRRAELIQRIGDIAWQAADMRTRGFLLGGTAGRTTLNGEGLQHEDGHSHILSSTIPNCISYDPTFAYEVVVIIRDGLRRMMQEQEDVYYYCLLYTSDAADE